MNQSIPYSAVKRCSPWGLLLAALICDASHGARPGPDFNADGYDDLVVGVPFEDINSIVEGGAINVIYGSTLAVGDFNNDGYDDLAIGAPFEEIEGNANAGAITIAYGCWQGVHGAL